MSLRRPKPPTKRGSAPEEEEEEEGGGGGLIKCVRKEVKLALYTLMNFCKK